MTLRERVMNGKVLLARRVREVSADGPEALREHYSCRLPVSQRRLHAPYFPKTLRGHSVAVATRACIFWSSMPAVGVICSLPN
jgi:hypothetical protein